MATVRYLVSDVDRAIRFYVDMLGFVKSWRLKRRDAAKVPAE